MFPGSHAATAPKRPAVVMAGSGKTLTYRELDDNSARLAAALHALGLRPGDVVALISDNSAEAFEVYWAALRSGLYITAVNWHLSPEEAAYILRDSGARAVIVSAGVRAVAEPIVSLVPGVRHWYVFGGKVPGYQPYAELLATAGPRLAEAPRGAEMLYSSGTTGRPKGIKPRRLPGDVDEPGDPVVALLGSAFGINQNDVYLSPAPIYHTAPLKWCAAVQALGGTVVLMERFDAEETLAAIERFRVTATQVVPTMFVRMLQLPKQTRTAYDTSSLRLAVHAAAPCPPEVKDAMISWWGPILVEYYGATEQHGTTVITTDEWRTKRGSVGRAAMGVLHICDDDGNDLTAGEIGTIYFERDAAPFEYHNDPEKTSASRHPAHDNWCTVGDVGYLDEDGYLFLTDRKGFMIISGGVNIYPQEIENVLALHPKIFDVAVIGVPDPEMGEQVKAVVALRDGIAPSDDLAAEIIAYVRERIARYKAPKSVDFVTELPRSATGKLVKRVLADRYTRGSTHV
ncbi:acyl-CoA synthetase [Mycobacterium persicum]|uniref:Acyl-CoA synthetase n=2 Tax=Mycobacterium persicum TaxID=1487726 RepID=A0A8E2ITL5_9MYCO|nr:MULTISPECIES: acyl-CoA synthetase [Mycobacterium]KZS84678.1 acyl-CoA synthetase [Mycobacterium persicum]ORB43074.1 acyl-CoA synthetase [Mycobacterium persicum]ORB96835.1 acyl-CoA synthetase [Mycobacterium persicum]ORC09002.1 acyl-CoA synthetase [Mycobacterium persicum]ORC13201.1 acyl-CoA synthetase [Mycobacterium kansasii]